MSPASRIDASKQCPSHEAVLEKKYKLTHLYSIRFLYFYFEYKSYLKIADTPNKILLNKYSTLSDIDKWNNFTNKYGNTYPAAENDV